MNEPVNAQVDHALRRIPASLFVLTAEHEGHRLGTLVRWVQRVCTQPPMVSVAVDKGQQIMPLLSESRSFGLCQLASDDRVLQRKFASESELEDDLFLGMELIASSYATIPILAQSLSYFECELVRHMDVDGDCDLFIGEVKAAGGREGLPYLYSVDESATPSDIA